MIGDVIPINIVFSEAVTVNTSSGVPQITLETGDTDISVSYVSGSGSNTLTFNYTVASGHVSSDLDYVSSNPFNLNNGTIVDLANNSANMTLPNAGAQNSLSSNKAIIVDGIISTITSVSSDVSDGTYRLGQTIPIKITFSEAVVVTAGGTPVNFRNRGPMMRLSITAVEVDPTH